MSPLGELSLDNDLYFFLSEDSLSGYSFDVSLGIGLLTRLFDLKAEFLLGCG